MRTKYYGRHEYYADCEGYRTDWEDTELFETAEEAENAVKKYGDIADTNYMDIGHWEVVAKTMDEATFTLTEKVIKGFNHNLIREERDAEKRLAGAREELEKAEAIKPKTARGEKIKATKIAENERYIKYLEEEVARAKEKAKNAYY